MSESALPYDIEPVPEPEVPEGITMPLLLPLRIGDAHVLTYDTNNLKAYFRVLANDLQDDITYGARLKQDTTLSQVFRGFQLDYPRLYSKIAEQQREEHELRSALYAEQPNADAQEKWSTWMEAHVRTGEQSYLMSEAFKAMVPDLLYTGIAPIEITK